MKKFLVFVTYIIPIIIFFFSAISRSADEHRITDMEGRTVTIPMPGSIKRVAVLTSPQVLNMYVIGEQEKLCAVTNAVKMWSLLKKADPGIEKIPAVRAQAGQVNIEALLRANPDFCIGSAMDMQVVEKSTSIPTLHVSFTDSHDYLQHQKDELLFFAGIFGKEDRAKKFIEYLDETIKITDKTVKGLKSGNKTKVFMGYNQDHLTTFGNDTFMNEWIRQAGCINAAEPVSSLGGREGGLAMVSMEQVLSWDPDIIVIDTGSPDDLYNDPKWKGIKAVKNKRVFDLPVGLFIWNRTSCEAAALLPRWLAITAYPDNFKNTDIGKEIKKFYTEIFRFDFSDDEILNILNPRGTGK